MFEFTITASSSHAKLINYFYSAVQKIITSVGGIIIKEQCGKNYCVSLAVEEHEKEFISAQIMDAVADAIIYYYKESYLHQSIVLHVANRQTFDVFINALVVFDKQTDRDIIKKHLVLGHKLVIDSFFVFRLSELRERWNSIACVVMENIPVMLKNRTVEEVTKYFVDSTEEASGVVEILAKNDKINLLASDKLLDIEFCLDADYQTDLVCELIALNPQKIIIHAEPKIAEDIERELSIVFDGKIVKNI